MKIINAKTLSEMITESEIGTTIDFAENENCWWHGITKQDNFDGLCYIIGYYGGGQTELLDSTLEDGNQAEVVEKFIKRYFKNYAISDEIYLDNDEQV